MIELKGKDLQIAKYFPLYVLSHTFIFKKKNSTLRNMSVFDAGCGTNVDIPYFFSLLGSKKDSPTYHLYEVDKNIHWLNILERRISEENIEKTFFLTFINAKFENLYDKLGTIFGDPAEKKVIRDGKFLRKSIDMLFMYSNMLYWLDFFNSDSSKAISNLIELLKQDGLLIIAQVEGQPLLDQTIFEKYSLELVESLSIQRNPFRVVRGIEENTKSFHLYLFEPFTK